MDTDYSRPMRVAFNSADNVTGIESRLQQTVVAVTCDDRAHYSTLAVLIGNLRRLPITLYLQASSDKALTGVDLESLEELAVGIDPDRPLVIAKSPTPTLHLHVGGRSPGANIAAVADGHGVRLRRRGNPFPDVVDAGTGLGAVLAGAMLTAEAFKQIVGVQPIRHSLRTVLDFNPVTLRADGPVRHLTTMHDTALIGCGAIGTAIGLILRESGIEGALTVVDPQQFDPPNVMTYSLGNQEDAARGLHKTLLLARELPQMDVHRVEGNAQEFINRIDTGRTPMPATVLGAVDSVEARHQIAKIYASLTLDGSTGGIAGTTVGLAEAIPTGPCLRCYYPTVPLAPGPSPEQQLSEMTGLDIRIMADGDRILSAQDLTGLPSDGARLLAQHLGKPVYGLARTLGLTGSEDVYRPSATFVSQQAAAVVVGSLIARANLGIDRMRDVEYDTLFGPTEDMVVARRQRRECQCQKEARLIDQIRASRGE